MYSKGIILVLQRIDYININLEPIPILSSAANIGYKDSKYNKIVVILMLIYSADIYLR